MKVTTPAITSRATSASESSHIVLIYYSVMHLSCDPTPNMQSIAKLPGPLLERLRKGLGAFLLQKDRSSRCHLRRGTVRLREMVSA